MRSLWRENHQTTQTNFAMICAVVPLLIGSLVYQAIVIQKVNWMTMIALLVSYLKAATKPGKHVFVDVAQRCNSGFWCFLNPYWATWNWRCDDCSIWRFDPHRRARLGLGLHRPSAIEKFGTESRGILLPVEDFALIDGIGIINHHEVEQQTTYSFAIPRLNSVTQLHFSLQEFQNLHEYGIRSLVYIVIDQQLQRMISLHDLLIQRRSW